MLLGGLSLTLGGKERKKKELGCRSLFAAGQRH